MKYYLAVDIGASGGRHILGSLQGGRMVLEEIYRFENAAFEENGDLFWDTQQLLREIVAGMKKCGEVGKIPVSAGIDTFGVDYALLDKNDALIGGVFCYRSHRTAKTVPAVHEAVSPKLLYEKTGIQFQPFNTIYQLYDDKQTGKLDSAESFLMLPDYLNFLLTGVKKTEYTDATTTGMVNARSNSWDSEIIGRLGYPEKLFGGINRPGETAGMLKPVFARAAGFNTEVVLTCSHDTASAVAAVPGGTEKALYLSSGTWSLLGAELNHALTSEDARALNFTNEGGYGGTYRFLKNITGLWIVQRLRAEGGNRYSFAEMAALAGQSGHFEAVFDANDARFLSPRDMRAEIVAALSETGQRLPESDGELFYSVYRSLARAYKTAAEDAERLTGRHYDKIHVVGGGSKNALLNRLCAAETGKTVIAGPAEATAIGNLAVQMIKGGEIADLAEARKIIKNSFEITEVYS